MTEYLTELAKYTAVTVISCAISYGITHFLNCSGLIALILNGLVAVCIPSVLYLILFRKNENFGSTLLLSREALSRSGKRK